eukprot:3172343-Lingulodinium_polyedra.AAC.1
MLVGGPAGWSRSAPKFPAVGWAGPLALSNASYEDLSSWGPGVSACPQGFLLGPWSFRRLGLCERRT